MSAAKFRIGDHVRVTIEGSWSDKTGTVADIQPSFRYPVFVDLDDGGQVAFLDAELVLAEVVTTTADLVAANNAEFVARLERKRAAKEAVKVTPVPVRSQILRTAEKLINGQRAKDYGEPADNYGRLAALLSAQFSAKLKEPLTAGDAVLAMVHLKLSRLANTPDHEDSFTDAIGYLALGAEIAEGL